jgi:subtilisin family serine protease
MRRLTGFVFLVLLLGVPAFAGGFIVHTSATDESQVEGDHALVCLQGAPTQGIYLMQASDNLSQEQVLSNLRSDPRVLAAEPDATALVPETPAAQLNQSTAVILDGLSNFTVASYYGAQVPSTYLSQPAATLIRLSSVQTSFAATGAGVVAIIDTGVDPHHPVLQNSLVAGYDFTRNTPGIPSELADLTQSTAVILDQSSTNVLNKNTIAVVNQSTAVIPDQSTAVILDTSQLPAAFGHGTMVAGIVHLVAPTASIMPLKAFRADGTGSLFDVVRAIYYATDNGAQVINMSFSVNGGSAELMRAVSYAVAHGAVVVASVGNSGQQALVYPAGIKNVFGVASTNNLDQRSSFSNYGMSIVNIAAPGEGIVTTYPGNNYASASGTSFSAPFVSGGSALLEQVRPGIRQQDVSQCFSHAKTLTIDLGFGRLDLYRAVQEAKD